MKVSFLRDTKKRKHKKPKETSKKSILKMRKNQAAKTNGKKVFTKVFRTNYFLSGSKFIESRTKPEIDIRSILSLCFMT